MSGIFGVVHLDGGQPDAVDGHRLGEAMRPWAPDGMHVVSVPGAVLGQCVVATTFEARFECGPVQLPSGGWLTSESRIDNRDELCDDLGVWPAERERLSDGAIVALAVSRWDRDAPNRLLGDWSLARWEPDARHLWLARDLAGRTSLFFARQGRLAAFATSLRALLTLRWIPTTPDDLHLAATLIGWHAERGRRTPYQHVHRVPSAASCTMSLDHQSSATWWSPRAVRPGGTHASAWVDLGRETLDAAVRARLRTHRPIVATLSGGLDSGAVVSCAADHLNRRGETCTALTAVPLYSVRTDPGVLGDEGPLARSVAQRYPNISHECIDSAAVTPLDGIDAMLAIHGCLQHGSENLYWLTALFRRAQDLGAGVMLTAQGGNLTMSWTGPPTWANSGWRAGVGAIRSRLAPARQRALQACIDVGLRRARSLGVAYREPWKWYSPIAPAWARDLRLADALWSAQDDLIHPAVASVTGDEVGGAFGAANGAAFGLEVRDPMLDRRVIELSLALPVGQWRGPLGRDFFRAVADTWLPERVRVKTRGLQGADVGLRLRLDADRLTTILAGASPESLPATRLDIPRLVALANRVNGGLSLAEARPLVRGLAAARFLTASLRG